MARRRYWHRRRPDRLEDALAPLFGLLSLAIIGYVLTHRAQVLTWGLVFLGVCLVAVVGFFVYKKRKRNAALNWDDDKIRFMLKGMSPTEFEQEMADMFRCLGYTAEAVGGANDGGIDVVARKDGKKYYIQCKKFMTREVTPHDVRDFLGAITNVSNPAEKGYFITTNKFTLAAERTAEGNPRIELIDGNRLVEYYKMAHGKNLPRAISADEAPGARKREEATPAQASAVQEQTEPIQTAPSMNCPECGGKLIARKGRYGEFLGSSTFPNCRYTQKL